MSFRLILFLALTVLFLVGAPLLTLRATGRWIDTKRWEIVETGGIAVNAAPAGTFIALEDEGGETKKISLLYPTAVFTRLLPGSYRISATAPGAARWEKIAAVDEGRTTAFPFSRLFAETPERLNGTFPGTPAGVSVNPSGSLLVGWDASGLFGVRLRDGSLLTGLSGAVAGDVERISWMNDAALFVTFRNGASAIIESPERSRPSVIPLPANLVEAHVAESGDLIARTANDQLLRIRRSATNLLSDTLAEDAAAAIVHGDAVSYVDRRGIAWTLNRDGSQRRQRTLTSLDGIAGNVRLAASPDGASLLVIDQTKSAWLLDEDADRFAVIAEGIRDAMFSPDGAKLLLLGTHEVSAFAVRERLDQPVRPKGWRETIVRLSDEIRNAAFVPQETEHIAVLAGETLRIAELDGRGGRNEMAVPEVAAFTIAERSRRILIAFTDGTIGSLAIPSPKFLQRVGPRTP